MCFKNCICLVVFQLHVLNHVPSGIHGLENTPYFRPEYHNRFNAIFRDNADIIIGMHAVHEHTDSFRMFYKGIYPIHNHSREYLFSTVIEMQL